MDKSLRAVYAMYLKREVDQMYSSMGRMDYIAITRQLYRVISTCNTYQDTLVADQLSKVLQAIELREWKVAKKHLDQLKQ